VGVPLNQQEQAEVEIHLFQDGGQIKIKKNVDHLNANLMPIDSQLPQGDPFSLVPTFKLVPRMNSFSRILNISSIQFSVYFVCAHRLYLPGEYAKKIFKFLENYNI
jgi:hypothetical protein